MNMDIIMERLRNFDENSRDEYGNVVKGNSLNQFVENLNNDDELDISAFNNYLKYDLVINKKYYKNINKKQFIFSEGINFKERKVDSFFKKRDIKNWNWKNNVFIFAGTGKGKNYFVEHFFAQKKHKKVVLFVNRESLFKQQKEIIKKAVAKDLDNKISSYEEDGIVKIHNQFMLVSYQKAAHLLLKKDKEFIEYLSNTSYAIFDEIHYLIDDADFNKSVNIIKKNLLTRDDKWVKPLSNATKIFMSATMEEMLVIFHEEKYKFEGDDYFVRMNEPNIPDNAKKMITVPQNLFLKLPADYSYINPMIYRELELLVDEIAKNKEKWLIFVDSKKEGAELCKEINERLGEKEAQFIHADNKQSAVFKEIIKNEKFENRVLIATSVIYNGVNISDEQLKNVVLPFTTVPISKQMIGRKRITNGEKVNVYFKDVMPVDIEDRFKEKLSEYCKVAEINRLGQTEITAYLNNMKKVEEKYIYAHDTGWKTILMLNEMAFYKLHFDTAFLLYLLKKISKEHSTYVREMLIHLGIEEKYEKAFENTLLPEKERKDRARCELEKLLTDNINGITEVSVDGWFPRIHEFSVRMDEIYVKLNRKIWDIHHIDKKRWISQEKANEFIESLGLPYSIEYTNKDRKTEIKSLKISKTCKGEK